jgi:hypothetical protein
MTRNLRPCDSKPPTIAMAELRLRNETENCGVFDDSFSSVAVVDTNSSPDDRT